jgi:hypothetical protein
MPQGPQHAMTPADGAAAIAKAAGKLQDAKNFTKSVNKQAGVPDKSDAPKASPAAASPAKPAVKEPSIGDELDAKAKNVKEYTDANPPAYHKGGKIKKDGEQVVNAEKGETVLPNKGKKRATELAMKHLDGMKDGMEKAAKKHVKPMKKKHGKVKKIHVHVNDDDTFSMTHEHHPNEDGSQNPDTTHSAQDMDQLMDHMQDHLGTPNPGEAEANAGPAATPPPVAGSPAGTV